MDGQRQDRVEPFLEFVLDQMGGASRPTSRAMFGGYGLFNGASMFGIIYRGVLYLKQAAHQSGAGTRPFKPRPSQTLWSFREVSAEVIEDRIVLQRRVARAIEAVLAAAQKSGYTKAID